MLSIIRCILLVSIVYSSCPQIIESQVFYEDECGNCWLPYCYDFSSHVPYYDMTEGECSSSGMMWVLPGDQGDPYFNNFCDSCPFGFYQDDCGDCWMEYCYNISIHMPFYDMTEAECSNAGLVWVVPGQNAGDPYWNSSCDETECTDGLVADCAGVCGGDSMLDECGVCQSPYCYDYVAHEITFEDCSGPTETLIMPSDEMNSYWNSTCTDCNAVVNGNSMIDDCGDCQSPYCYDYISNEVTYSFPCDGSTQIEVLPNSDQNPNWNSGCSGDDGGDDSNACDDCMDDCVSYVMANYGYTAEAAAEWCSTTPDAGYGCMDTCMDSEECLDINDPNGDGELNITDIVGTVAVILGNASWENECAELNADVNGDGSINIVDLVQMVQLILNGRYSDATSAKIIKNTYSTLLNANGFVGAVQMTLTHGDDFNIELTDDAMVADYKTTGNSTTLIIVNPESEELFIADGTFEISEVIVANSANTIDVLIATPDVFSLSSAYPNPFNPTTSVALSLPNDAHVSVTVYNLMGQTVATIADGYMTANVYNFSWNASNVPSGMYFIRAEAGYDVAIQKVMLLK